MPIEPPSTPATVAVALPYPGPLDLDQLLDFIRTRAIPGVEETVSDGGYRRSLRVGGATAVLEIHAVSSVASRAAGQERVRAVLHLEDSADAEAVVQRCRRLLDLDVDPVAISAALGADPLLQTSVHRRPGLRMPRTVEPFELAVRAILGQQVSVRGARTLAGRVVARHGGALSRQIGGVTHLFPEPATLAVADLGGLGITGARIRSIVALSAAVVAGDLTLDGTQPQADVEAELLALPGIGPWTVAYIAMRGLGDTDAFPAGDLGLQRAMERLGRWTGRSALLQRAERWRPWRAYAALHLWSTLSDPSPQEFSR